MHVTVGGHSPKSVAPAMAAALALVVALTVGPAPQVQAAGSAALPTAVPRDVIILLDITGSMRGLGPDPAARDIWAQVVLKVIQQITDLPDGSTLAIVPFDAGPRVSSIWPTNEKSLTDQIPFTALDSTTRASAIRSVQGLVADGQQTWICDTLAYGLQELQGWRDKQAVTQRIQNVFLYTDGLDTGGCKNNFSAQLTHNFCGAKQDYPYLFGVYIDINAHLTAAEKQALLGCGIYVNGDLPAFIDLDPGPTDLGPWPAAGGVDLTLHFTGVTPGSAFTATTAVLPASLGLVVSPALITVAPSVVVHLDSTQTVAPGSKVGTVALTSASGNFQFSGNTTDFLFQVAGPTPTPTPAPTPTPTPTPTPAPTPVPAAALITVNPPTDRLGTIAAGSSDTLNGTIDLSVALNQAAVAAADGLELRVEVDGREDVSRAWFVTSGAPTTRMTVSGTGGSGAVNYRIAGSDVGEGWLPGSRSGQVRIVATPMGSGLTVTVAGASPDLAFPYEIQTALGLRHLLALLLLLAVVLLVLYLAFQPRFPKRAKLIVRGGASHDLRGLSERGLRRRLRPRELTVGSAADDINIGVTSRVIRLTPRRRPFSIGRGRTYVVPIAGHPALVGRRDPGVAVSTTTPLDDPDIIRVDQRSLDYAESVNTKRPAGTR